MLRSLLQVLRDAAAVFAGRALAGHLVAIALTVACVVSGLDGWTAETLRGTEVQGVARFAGRIGLWTPILAPPALWMAGLARRDRRIVSTGWRLAEAEVLALAICAAYKALTGRPGPMRTDDVAATSHVFRFGFLRGGVYWGWPSSHVMVAVAGATAVARHALDPVLRTTAVVYAAGMAVCVAASFHWFSDALAGAIVGIVIGSVVARRVDGSPQVPR